MVVAVAQEVPGGADAVKGGGGRVGEGVALLGQVFDHAVGVGAGAGELVPHVHEVLIVLGGDYLVGEHHLVVVDAVAQPGGVAARAERHAAHRVAAARGVHRGGHAALEELGLGYGHLRPALAERAGLESRHVGVVEVAHRGHIDVLVAGEYAALGARLGTCIGARLIRRDRGRIHTAARGQRQHHRKTQCRRQCSLYPVCHHFLPLQIYIQMPPISAAFRAKLPIPLYPIYIMDKMLQQFIFIVNDDILQFPTKFFRYFCRRVAK